MNGDAPGQDGAGAPPRLGASPALIANPQLRHEAGRALVWVGVIGLAALVVLAAQPLLMLFGALVFAAMVDGGARLLGRVLPIARGWRVALTLLAGAAFLLWLANFAGTQISRQAALLPDILMVQAERTLQWLSARGYLIEQQDVRSLLGQIASGAGTISSAIGGVLGALTTLLVITVVGIYVAVEPRLYERGVAWMLPKTRREHFYGTISIMAHTMRRLMFGRLLGMVFEGVFTYAMLAGYGIVTGEPIPMAALLAILTGVLAFIPNVGAFISGILMVTVGFSGGTDMGLYTIIVYLVVQNIDGYVVIPIIARKTVDLAPAVVIGMQLIMGVFFGILGLFLADPLLAMIKVALERRSQANARTEARMAREEKPA